MSRYIDSGRLAATAVLLLGLSLGLQAGEKKGVAVLEFRSAGGVDPSEAAILTNRFRGILVNTQKFEVVERDKMRDILNAQDFNISDACNSAECAVQVGQLLGVEQMIAGDIGKIGQTWTIDLRLIDVQTGKIVVTKSEDFKGEIDGLLDIMRNIAISFAGDFSTTPVKVAIPAAPKVGDLYINSKPAGALILIGGEMTEWTTPKLLERYPAGEYHIGLRGNGLKADTTVLLAVDAFQKVDMLLAPARVTVKILSEPLGATLLINDEVMGETPTAVNVATGKQRLTLVKDGFRDFSVEVVLSEDDENKKFVYALQKAVTVSFNLVPDKGRLFVDGTDMGVGSTVLPMITGKHMIRVVVDDPKYELYEKEVEISSDTSIEVVVQKKKKR